MRSRIDSILPPPVAFTESSSAGTLGGGGGGGDPSSTSITHLPRYTGEVRSETDVSARMLPCPSIPRRSGGSDTRRNALPVMLGMP